MKLRSQYPRLIILLGAISCVDAFFPVPWKEVIFGAGGVSHQEQTEQAFQTLATRYFPEIDHLTKGMTKARDTIAEANAEVDKDQHTAALHCDGESFDAAQTRLQTLQQNVLDALNSNDAQTARQSLGSALHTVQDFYAHSNWIEMGNSGPSDVLGRPASMAYAGPNDTTCGACITTLNPFVCNDCSVNELGYLGELTSGYYFGEDTPASGDIPDFKCHHGGFTDNSFGSAFGLVAGKATQGINKDSLNCGFSPHYYAHSDAVDVAIQATIQYIDDIKQKITESQLRQLFGVGPTFAFCIDTTGSMGDIIASVQEQSIAIVNERLGTPDEPSSYVISPFNDPDTGPVSTTSNFTVFQDDINALFAEGGGDCPELSMTGMLNALAVLDDDSVLFMFTDAASKDADLESEVIDQANAKSINIYIFKFDSGCDDGLSKRIDSSADKVYGSISLATGGQYHSLPRAEVTSVGSLIDTLTSSDNSFILRIIDGTLSVPTESYKVPVDSAMTQLSISLLGSDATMNITQPDGTPLDLTSTDVINIVLTDGEFVTIKNVQVGVWNVVVTSTANYTLDASGTSSLHFTSFVFSALAGRPGHDGFFPIAGPPPYNTEIAAIAGLDGSFSTATFDFRSPAGPEIQPVPMTPGTGLPGDPPPSSFFTLLNLTSSDSFFVYVSGTDSAGKEYQRVLPALVIPEFSNSTFNVSTTTLALPGSPSTTSSFISSSTSYANSSTTAPYNNATTTTSVGSAAASSTVGGEETVTEIIYTTITTCPVTIGSTVIGGSTSYEVSISTSTIVITSTSTLPCHKCLESPNYGGVPPPTATPTVSAEGVLTISEIIYTTISICPDNSESTLTLTSTSTLPCHACTPGGVTLTLTSSHEAVPAPVTTSHIPETVSSIAGGGGKNETATTTTTSSGVTPFTGGAAGRVEMIRWGRGVMLVVLGGVVGGLLVF